MSAGRFPVEPDYSALENELIPQELDAWKNSPAKQLPHDFHNPYLLSVLLGIVGTMCIFPILVNPYLFPVSAIIITIISYVVIRGYQNVTYAEVFLLDKFCKENDFVFTSREKAPRSSSQFFSRGHHRRVTNKITGPGGQFIMANFIYATGFAKYTDWHENGYIAIKLDAPLAQGKIGINATDDFKAEEIDGYLYIYANESFELSDSDFLKDVIALMNKAHGELQYL